MFQGCRIWKERDENPKGGFENFRRKFRRRAKRDRPREAGVSAAAEVRRSESIPLYVQQEKLPNNRELFLFKGCRIGKERDENKIIT